MEIKINKIKDFVVNPQNRTKLLIIIGLIGVLLIMCSEINPKLNDKAIKSNVSYDEYIDELEEKTENIISLIDGVGSCKVMITLATSNESIYAQNIDEKTDSSSISQKSEYVFNDKSDGDEPVLIKEYFPNVQGVVVVCSGGDNSVVREKVIGSISSLYNVPTSNISVTKLKG